MNHALGALIKIERITQGKLQNTVASKVGISTSLLSAIEHSKNYPGHENLKKLCDELNINFEFAMNKLLFEKYGIKQAEHE